MSKNFLTQMEKTLVILKPSAVVRGIMGEIISRFERKGLIIIGMKMMRLSDELLKEHYAHLVDKPFFPSLVRSMQASPVVVLCVKGVDAVAVVRKMTGATNGRNADRYARKCRKRNPEILRRRRNHRLHASNHRRALCRRRNRITNRL